MLQDKDLQSIQEVRDLVRRAHQAQKIFETFSQEQVDSVVQSMASAALREAKSLGELAVEETGYGNPADKLLKNLFVAKNVAEYIRPLRTMGIISEDPMLRITEIAIPMGVVAAIIPSTNPTSTTIFKCLISLKAGNGVVLSPHPAAVRCIAQSAVVCRAAAVAAGAPDGIIGCMSQPTMESTQELMRHKQVAVVLATGGAGLVRAAYSSGKPAYGVGPGNVPSYVDRSAEVPKAVRDILTGKTFDNGTLCSSEQSIVVDSLVEEAVCRELERNGAYFVPPGEVQKLESAAIQSNGLLNPIVVGKSARWIADRASIPIPDSTRVLVVRMEGVGRDHPLSCEKLSPILTYYSVRDWREGCERCKEILAFGGMGHTLSIHCKDAEVIRQFGLQKPAFRICVNTPATHGSIGLSTALPPSMTLGCGTFGNNITTDNITPMHLIQIKRLAEETREVFPSWYPEQAASIIEQGVDPTRSSAQRQAPIEELVASYLSRRKRSRSAPAEEATTGKEKLPEPRPTFSPPPPKGRDFVCEQDVRTAIHAREKIHIHRKTIVTPAARDLGLAHEIFVDV